MVRLRKLNGMLLCFCILTSVLISIFQMNTHDTYSRMHSREYLTETDIQKLLRHSTEHKIIIYRVLVRKATQIEIAHILDRNCLLRTLEIAFQSIKTFEEACPHTPLVVHPFGACLICW